MSWREEVLRSFTPDGHRLTLAVGLKTEPEQDNKRRLDSLLRNVRDAIPEPQSNRHG